MLIFFNNEEWKNQLKSTLMKHFNMKDLGEATSVLGIRINYDHEKAIITLDQRKYTEQILRRFNMFDCDPVKLPSDPNQKLTSEMSPTTEEQFEQMKSIPYQEAVGSIMYLAQCTRPDISFSILSQFKRESVQQKSWNGSLEGSQTYSTLFKGYVRLQTHLLEEQQKQRAVWSHRC